MPRVAWASATTRRTISSETFLSSTDRRPTVASTALLSTLIMEVMGESSWESRLIAGTNLLATSSELATAKALGRSSPKKRVIRVRAMVMDPRPREGKKAEAVVTKRAVL